MKSVKRIFVSLMALAVIFFMNPGFLAINAYAWETWNSNSGWNNNPTWSSPGWESSPEWTNPGWETAPEWQTKPDWTKPAWETAPEWQTKPDWTKPAWETAPEWNNQPEWNTKPWETKPEWNSGPGNNNPNGPSSNPNGNNPGNNPGSNPNNPSTVPGGNTNNPPPGPPYSQDYKNPGLETLDQLNQTKNPPSNNSSNTAEDPFLSINSPKPYDVLKYSAKDIVGGTINLADKVVRGNDLELKDYLDYKKGLAVNGFKTLTKGDPTLDAIYDAQSVYKNSKDLYQKYKTFEEFRNINNLKKAGDIIEAAEKFDDLYRAGKTFTPGNAIVSAVTLPFAVNDTVNNVKKFNSAGTSEEKTAAAFDLVGNSGEIITGLAPAVALIPGAQPIAAGMVVVGGVLSLASLGHKMYRNREKIVKDVKKKFNKAKEKVTGFFKSVFG
ncbi:hypothetical protein [Bacillus infantis]|nr:hypothetical protein [Bacillus infantis]MCA1037806.1 hypothetical protein [Bacillus infantis]MCP1156486.1 hypothetical protein [Bacillus infantis]OXT14851.1 hypothetical protein B9K06_23995 [Bacillus sp. OG2]